MLKKNFIKILILLFLLYGCGYTPIYTNKDYNFTIISLQTNGNDKLNKIITNRLGIYKNTNSKKQFNLIINTNLEKEVASKDSKGNPKTFRIVLNTKIIVSDSEGITKEKSFSKTLDYNNKSKKSELKKYEDRSGKNLAEKISEEIIIYLVSN
tara:strand:+ start:1002 stop:1460 length:459 start_codon:yes stop_codon:yes gene_type:complete